MKPVIRSLIAGAAWGAASLVIARLGPWYATVGILLSGPLIGLAVFWVSRWAYDSRFSTALWTIPSVYLATAIFGLLVGLLDSIARGAEMIVETALAALWGLSHPSPLWLIFPLAFATHLWVRAGGDAAHGIND